MPADPNTKGTAAERARALVCFGQNPLCRLVNHTVECNMLTSRVTPLVEALDGMRDAAAHVPRLVSALVQVVDHEDHDEYCDGCVFRKRIAERALESADATVRGGR